MSFILPLVEFDRLAAAGHHHDAVVPRHPYHHLTHTGYHMRPWVNRALAVADLKHLDGAEKTSHIGKDGFQVSLGMSAI